MENTPDNNKPNTVETGTPGATTCLFPPPSTPTVRHVSQDPTSEPQDAPTPPTSTFAFTMKDINVARSISTLPPDLLDSEPTWRLALPTRPQSTPPSPTTKDTATTSDNVMTSPFTSPQSPSATPEETAATPRASATHYSLRKRNRNAYSPKDSSTVPPLSKKPTATPKPKTQSKAKNTAATPDYGALSTPSKTPTNHQLTSNLAKHGIPTLGATGPACVQRLSADLAMAMTRIGSLEQENAELKTLLQEARKSIAQLQTQMAKVCEDNKMTETRLASLERQVPTTFTASPLLPPPSTRRPLYSDKARSGVTPPQQRPASPTRPTPSSQASLSHNDPAPDQDHWRQVENDRKRFLRVTVAIPAGREAKPYIEHLIDSCLLITSPRILKVKPLQDTRNQYSVEFRSYEDRQAVYEAYFTKRGWTYCVTDRKNTRWYINAWHSKTMVTYLRHYKSWSRDYTSAYGKLKHRVILSPSETGVTITIPSLRLETTRTYESIYHSPPQGPSPSQGDESAPSPSPLSDIEPTQC